MLPRQPVATPESTEDRLMRLITAVLSVTAVLVMTGTVLGAEPTRVMVKGPADWTHEPFTLEIGNRAWAIGTESGGIASADLGAAATVRLRELPGCSTLVRFVAQPGGAYVVRFTTTGRIQVTDRTTEGLDAGPGLEGGGSPVCPPLPDTSTAKADLLGRSPIGFGSALILVFPVGCILAIGVLSIRGQRPPTGTH